MCFDDVALAARVVVAFVLVASGVGKLLGLWTERARFAELGRVGAVGMATAAGLPLVELAVASIVLFVHAVWPTFVALGLFACFTVVVVRRYVAGDLRPCNCFGQISPRTALSNVTIARNVWFLLLAFLSLAADEVADPTHPATTLVIGAALAGVSGMLLARG